MRAQLWGLAGAAVLLAGLDVAIDRLDLVGWLLPATRPTTLFGSVSHQLAEVVHTLARPPAEPPVVFLGNSQMEALVRPLGATTDALASAGAPPGTRALSLCVFGTAPTDAEVIGRDIARLRPRTVVLGVSAPDLGTPLERARTMPVVGTLDVGWRTGLVPPADLEGRLDRWVRTGWRLYRYRTLMRPLLLPSDERRTPAGFIDVRHTPAETFAATYGEARARELATLRGAFAASGRYEDFVRYLAALHGPGYVPGLRSRWREVEAAPIQLAAVRTLAAHVAAAGARLVILLVPENPLLVRDPVIGAEVPARSAAAAARLAETAAPLGVPVVDLRTVAPEEAFLDLNHLFYYTAAATPALARALAAVRAL